MARCESRLVIPLLDTGSEGTAHQQPQQYQQFETEENGMVDMGREIVELETRGKEQEELLLQLPSKQQQKELQPPAAPFSVWTSHLVTPLLETGSERLHSNSRSSCSSRQRKMGWWLMQVKKQWSFKRRRRDGSTVYLRKYSSSRICRAPWEQRLPSHSTCGLGL